MPRCSLSNEQIDAKLATILLHLPYLVRGAFTGYQQVLEARYGQGRRRMIHCRQRQVGPAHGQTALT
jgi:hypothetical protein